MLGHDALVAERYRIGRRLGRGGMGEVYEAHDIVLDTRVALKTLRHERLARTDAIDAMKRELALARSVTHTNVARVFDIGVHGSGEGALAFFTMELLEGESLSDRIRDKGAMTVEGAIEIMRELTTALASLHAAGIVHRDFKASNVLLVPLPDGKQRVIVTDFGLATKTDAEADGRIAGTPATMAPEQVRGEPVTPQSDLFALGVVFFEMLTGKLPFDEATPEATARARLDRDAADVGSLRSDLPRPVRRLVRDLLAREPRDRPASAEETALRLQALDEAPQTRRRLVWGAGAFTALGIAILAWRGGQGSSPPVAARAEAPTFVLGDLAGDSGHEGVAKSLTALLAQELHSGDAVRSPAPEARNVVARALATAATPSPTDLSRARAAAGVDVVALGAAHVSGGKVHLDVSLFDTEKGTKLGSVSVDGTESDLAALTKSAASEIRVRLGRTAPVPEGAHLVPSDAKAALDYALALEDVRTLHHAEAITALDRVVAVAPDFAPGYTALARAYLALGRDQEARAAADQAVARAKSLPRADELAVYALAAQTKKAWDEAVTHYQALAHFYPDRVDHVTGLARALVFGGKPAEGRRVLLEALARPHSQWDEVALNLSLSYASGRAADDKTSLESAERAETVARSLGAEVAVADAQLQSVDVLLRQGKRAEAIPLLDKARATYAAMNDRANLAGCDEHRAFILLADGKLDEALKYAEQSLQYARDLGHRYLIAHKLTGRGIIEGMSSKHVRAVQTFAESRVAYAAVGDREGVGHAMVDAVMTETEMGDFSRLEPELSEAQKLFEQVGMKRGVAEVEVARGVALERRGYFTAAVPHLEKCVAIIEEVGDAGIMADARLSRARVALARSEPDLAAQVEQATRAVEAAGDPHQGTELLVLKARVALRAHDAKAAVEHAQSAVKRAAASHVPDAMADADGAELLAFAAAGSGGPNEADVRKRVADVLALDAVDPRIGTLLGAGMLLRDAKLLAQARDLAATHDLRARVWEIDELESRVLPNSAAAARVASDRVDAKKRDVRDVH